MLYLRPPVPSCFFWFLRIPFSSCLSFDFIFLVINYPSNIWCVLAIQSYFSVKNKNLRKYSLIVFKTFQLVSFPLDGCVWSTFFREHHLRRPICLSFLEQYAVFSWRNSPISHFGSLKPDGHFSQCWLEMGWVCLSSGQSMSLNLHSFFIQYYLPAVLLSERPASLVSSLQKVSRGLCHGRKRYSL